MGKVWNFYKFYVINNITSSLRSVCQFLINKHTLSRLNLLALLEFWWTLLIRFSNIIVVIIAAVNSTFALRRDWDAAVNHINGIDVETKRQHLISAATNLETE